MGMEYIETSAKNSTNVNEAFRMLISQIKERMKSEPLSAASEGKQKNRCVRFVTLKFREIKSSPDLFILYILIFFDTKISNNCKGVPLLLLFSPLF